MTNIEIARAAGRAEAYAEVLEHLSGLAFLLGSNGGWFKRLLNRYELMFMNVLAKSIEALRDNGPGEATITVDRHGNVVEDRSK